MINDSPSDSQSLGEELACAIADDSLPQMLRTLMKTAQLELQAWYEGTSARGLTIARHAVAEWHRWRLDSRGR
jgi:hypothetical protein